MLDVAHLLQSLKTIVVVGPGGVGKTTTSAALALEGARMGMKVIVLTVDPAKRLATSLGLERLSHEETRISPSYMKAAGLDLGDGAMFAMMLDTKRTFDDVISQHAPSPASRERILNNPYYIQASTAMAGSQEYMAMEKLYELCTERDYDLLVLDTPPAANTQDFFSAPERMMGFMDSRSLKLIMAGAKHAGRLGRGLFDGILTKVMNRFIGADQFLDLLAFLESFSEMQEGFSERANRVARLLRDDETGFAIITSTDAVPLRDAIGLRSTLREEGMPLVGCFVNRVRSHAADAASLATFSEGLRAATLNHPKIDAPTRVWIDACAEDWARAAVDYSIVAQHDRDQIELLEREFGLDARRITSIPLFSEDICDLAGLASFGDIILGR